MAKKNADDSDTRDAVVTQILSKLRDLDQEINDIKVTVTGTEQRVNDRKSALMFDRCISKWKERLLKGK